MKNVAETRLHKAVKALREASYQMEDNRQALVEVLSIPQRGILADHVLSALSHLLYETSQLLLVERDYRRNHDGRVEP